MGGHNMWGRLAAAGTEPPLWPFTDYFWKLIEENPEITYTMLASALLDEAAATRDKWFSETAAPTEQSYK
eukprot:11847790-Prorocentrum_lima.AAC.1